MKRKWRDEEPWVPEANPAGAFRQDNRPPRARIRLSEGIPHDFWFRLLPNVGPTTRRAEYRALSCGTDEPRTGLTG